MSGDGRSQGGPSPKARILLKLIIEHIAYATNRAYRIYFYFSFKRVTYTFNIPIYCSIVNISIRTPNIV